MKSSYVMDTCKYLAIMIIIFYTTLIISRSLNWQSNIIKFMTIREGYTGGDIFGDDSDDSDDGDDGDDSDDEEEEEFDPDDFRDKVRKILDLLDDIKKKEGEGYFNMCFGGLEQTDDYKLARELWDEDEDEWMEDAYSTANETRFENYYNKLMPYAKNIDKKFENQKSPKGFKKQYGETGITYAKRGLSILLDKDMGMDMGGGLEKSSGMGFSF